MELYHAQNVNACHSRLQGWLYRFEGAATRHLDNYPCCAMHMMRPEAAGGFLLGESLRSLAA